MCTCSGGYAVSDEAPAAGDAWLNGNYNGCVVCAHGFEGASCSTCMADFYMNADSGHCTACHECSIGDEFELTACQADGIANQNRVCSNCTTTNCVSSGDFQ